MRTQQAIKNMIASLLLQVVLALSGIIVPRFFIAVYGSSINGLVSSISQFITYMGIVEAGIGAAGTVALYGPIARNNIDDISSILAAAKKFYRKSGIFFVLLLVALVIFYPYAVNNEIENLSFIRIMILVLAVNGIVDYFYLGKYRVLLQANQQGYVIAIAQMVGTVVMTIVSIVMINMEMSALLVKSVSAVIYLARSLAVGAYVKKHFPDVDYNAKPNMDAFSQRWAALLHQIVGMIVNNAAVVLLTLFLSVNVLAEISVYSTFNLVAYSLSALMMAISNGLGAGFGQVISQKETDVLECSFSTYEFLFFIVIFVAYSCMFVLLHPFIVLYSADFADPHIYTRWSLVILFSIAGLLQSIRLPGLTLICSAGHYEETKWRAIAEATINIVASIILIKPFGLEGVMMGGCISYLYRTLDVIFYSAKVFFSNRNLGKTLFRLFINIVVFVVVMILGLRFIPQDVDSWGIWFLCAIVYGIIVSIIYVGVNFLFDIKEGKAVIRRFLDILGK